MTLLCAYSFDEASGNVLDVTGNGHDFAISGNTIRTASGHTAQGLTQTAAATAAGPSLTGLQPANRTWMTWIKFAAAVNGWILEFHQNAANTGVWGLLDISGTLRFRAKDSSNTIYESTAINRNLGNWQHIAATYDGANLKVYINGTLLSTTPMTAAIWTADLLNVLDQTGSDVILDDVRFYDTALDATAITAAMNTPASIANTWTSSTVLTAAATSVSIDITAAPSGDWVYCFAAIGANQTGVTMTGWTVVLEGDESTSTHYALLRRKKQVGDTTFTLSWPTSSKGTFGLSAWTGLDASTPDELAQVQLHTTGTTYPTPSVTPGGSGRYAATFTYSRTSTSANKAISFTPDAALAERLDFNNSGAASAPWTGQEIADSSAPVTIAAHGYTAVQAFTESHGGAILLYLVPPQSGITGTIALTQGPQTGTATGQLGYSGTIAQSQGPQTGSASGTVINPVTGSIALIQGTQTGAASGQLGYSGTVALVQAAQTGSATGQLGYNGTIALTQGAQTGSATGTVSNPGSYTGTIALVQGPQTGSASGTVINPVTGTVALVQGNQTGSASGQLGYAGTIALIKSPDVLVATGSVSGPVTGTIALVQGPQTGSATGSFAPLVTFGTASGGIGAAAKASAGAGSGPKASAGSMIVPTATGG